MIPARLRRRRAQRLGAALGVAAVLGTAACRGTPAPHASAEVSPTAAPVASFVPAREFVGCGARPGDEVDIHGIRWSTLRAQAEAHDLICELQLESDPRGATLEVAYSASSRAVRDVEARLSERPDRVTGVEVLRFDDLDVGQLAGGVAFREPGVTTFRLYAATVSSVVYLQARMPRDVVSRSADDDPRRTALALLTWAATHVPPQR